MMPVHQRIIKPDFQPELPARLHIFPHEIPAGLGVGGTVVGQLAVEEAEAVVVLGGENGVFHARLFGDPGPAFRLEIGRVELVEVLLIVLVADLLDAFDPLAPGWDGVQPPVDEHPEAVGEKPAGALPAGADEWVFGCGGHWAGLSMKWGRDGSMWVSHSLL